MAASNNPLLFSIRAITCAAILATAASPAGAAEASTDNWQFGAVIYGWLPSLSGDVNIPDGSSQDIQVDAGDIIDGLQFTAMASFEVRKGAWAGFTDVIYLSLGGNQSQSVSVATGASRTLFDADMDITGWVWTVGGSYSVWRDKQSHLDLLGGARLLSMDIDLKLSDGGRLQRDRKLSDTQNLWAGIIGAKGRIALNDRWFIPYYADIGAGSDSLKTWQAFGGIGYAFNWGEVSLTYRYLSYDQGNNGAMQDLSLGGPKLGVGFRF